MFEPTLPVDPLAPPRGRFVRPLGEAMGDGAEFDAGTTRLSALDAALVADLKRFDASARENDGLEAVEVLAAAVRHGRALLLQLQHGYRKIEMTVFPADGSMRCSVSLPELLALELSALRVRQVEPARLKPLGSYGPPGPGGATEDHHALGPLLWELALRGARETLLPEIDGRVAYRVAPGSALQALGLDGTLGAAVRRLRRQTCNLNEVASWPGFDRERAMRLLNALYLQAALIVSRTHPAATDDDHVSDPA